MIISRVFDKLNKISSAVIKQMIKRVNLMLKILTSVGLFLVTFNVYSISQLTIEGEYLPPGISGVFPDGSDFSWIKHRFPTAESYFSWRIGGGTDGGLVFGQPQAYGELTDVFTMFNQSSVFYSVNDGISINSDNTIDMSNLRMSHSTTIIDIGSGSGYDTNIHFVDDLLAISAGESGWTIDSSGAYHLFYTTRGICVDCEMTIYLTGTAIVPLPAAVWLMLTGLFSLFVINRSTRKNTGLT